MARIALIVILVLGASALPAVAQETITLQATVDGDSVHLDWDEPHGTHSLIYRDGELVWWINHRRSDATEWTDQPPDGHYVYHVRAVAYDGAWQTVSASNRQWVSVPGGNWCFRPWCRPV